MRSSSCPRLTLAIAISSSSNTRKFLHRFQSPFCPSKLAISRSNILTTEHHWGISNGVSTPHSWTQPNQGDQAGVSLPQGPLRRRIHRRGCGVIVHLCKSRFLLGPSFLLGLPMLKQVCLSLNFLFAGTASLSVSVPFWACPLIGHSSK